MVLLSHEGVGGFMESPNVGWKTHTGMGRFSDWLTGKYGVSEINRHRSNPCQ